jgi:hypothetical protein
VSEPDPLDERLNLAWRTLSPPADLAARVRVRLASTGGAVAAATLGARVASRWRALRASGPLGAGAGALLLGVGVALGYLIPREPADAQPADAQPADAQPADAQPADAQPADAQPAPERSAPLPAEARPLPPALPPVSSAPASIPRAAEETSTSASSVVSSVRDSPTPDSPAPASSPRKPAAPPRARAHRAGSAPVAKEDASAELLLLERAERAVRSRNPALALALIGELEQSFPRSRLHEERRSIELMAHCQALGPSSEANADTKADIATRRERFLRQYPESVYFARIADECDAANSVVPRATPPTNSSTPDIDGAQGGNDVQ